MFPTTSGGKEAGKDARRDAPDHPGSNSGNEIGNITHLLLPRPLLPYQRRRPIENQNSGKNGKQKSGNISGNDSGNISGNDSGNISGNDSGKTPMRRSRQPDHYTAQSRTASPLSPSAQTGLAASPAKKSATPPAILPATSQSPSGTHLA